MNKKRNRLILLITLVICLIICGIAGKKFIVPIKKLLKGTPQPEAPYIARSLENEAPNAIYFDFEVDPSKGNTEGLNKGEAHSGQFSAKVFGKESYSRSVERSLSQIGLKQLDAIGISAWVYIYPTDKEVKGTLVFDASDEKGKNLRWEGIGVNGPALPKGEWFKVNGLFDLSTIQWKPDYKIKVYFWNTSDTKILVDDFYIVFGKGTQRRGDSTHVDLTSGKIFEEAFNRPPFPVKLLVRKEINNKNSKYLINDGKVEIGEVLPNDRIFTGQFTGNPDGKEDILVIKQSGVAEMYHFCDDSKSFTRLTTQFPPSLTPNIATAKLLVGKFTSTDQDQLLFFTAKEAWFGQFDKTSKVCITDVPLKLNFKITSATNLNGALYANTLSGKTNLALDVNGDKLKEILCITNSGSWELLKVNESPNEFFKIIATGKENAIAEWNAGKYNLKIHSGHFVDGNTDQLLTVTRDLSNNLNGYSLLKFDETNKNFTTVLAKDFRFPGKTIGPDSLKVEDEYFTGIFDSIGLTKVFRYNRDWRYDFKEIRFQDNTFKILNNLDLSGYSNDQNPKYYEIMVLVPGCFLKKGVNDFLVILRNCKEKENNSKKCRLYEDNSSLPNMIQVYTYPKP